MGTSSSHLADEKGSSVILSLGLDLAKRVFALHGPAPAGRSSVEATSIPLRYSPPHHQTMTAAPPTHIKVFAALPATARLARRQFSSHSHPPIVALPLRKTSQVHSEYRPESPRAATAQIVGR